MVLPLDFLLLIVITILTITLLLVNYVAYLSRGRRYGPFYEAAALVSGSVAISAFRDQLWSTLDSSTGLVHSFLGGASRSAGRSCSLSAVLVPRSTSVIRRAEYQLRSTLWQPSSSDSR